MSDTNLDAAIGTLAWSLVRARGPESESYLQGQLSQDLALVTDAGSWALLLEPDSVVMTTCFVRRREDGFDVTVPRELVDVATKRLRRFLLRTKCTLEVADATEGPFSTLAEQIDARWPGVAEFAGSLTPHCFGRTFVATTISFQKGCFTGQELVGRLDARGSSVPWRLVHVAGPNVEDLDTYLRSKGPSGPQGVTSVTRRDGAVEGLGIAHRTLLTATDAPREQELTIDAID